MKKILIIGAGMLQTHVIKKAKQLGYYTAAVDGNPSAEGFEFCDEYRCINIVDCGKCLEYAEEIGVDGVLTAATDYGVITTAHIAEKLNLKGISPDKAELIKNKYSVREYLAERNAESIPQFFQLTSDDEIDSAAKEAEYPMIIKPCDGSGSKGVACVNDIESFRAACRDALSYSLSGKCIAESFISGEEYGVESFVDEEGVHVLAVMKKRMTEPPYYAELGHSAPCGLPKPIEDKVRLTAENTIKALGLEFGCVNMDMIVSAEGRVCVVDIGARMGGNLIGSHIVPLHTGIDYMGNMIRAHLGEEHSFTADCVKKPVATALLALTPGEIKSIPDFPSLLESSGAADIIFNKCEGGIINEYHNNLDGCGYVVVTDDDVNAAAARAEQLRKEIDRLIVRTQA